MDIPTVCYKLFDAALVPDQGLDCGILNDGQKQAGYQKDAHNKTTSSLNPQAPPVRTKIVADRTSSDSESTSLSLDTGDVRSRTACRLARPHSLYTKQASYALQCANHYDLPLHPWTRKTLVLNRSSFGPSATGIDPPGTHYLLAPAPRTLRSLIGKVLRSTVGKMPTAIMIVPARHRTWPNMVAASTPHCRSKSALCY